MNVNLNRLIDNVVKIPDRMTLSEEEKVLVEALKNASNPGEVKITKKNLAMLAAIDRRSKLTDQDKQNIKKIVGKIMKLRPIRKKKSVVF